MPGSLENPGAPELSDSILNRVLENKSAIVVSDALHDQEFNSSVSVVNFRLSSVMCAPLMWQGKLLGAIYVANNAIVSAFDQESLSILSVFAGQASLIVQNALHLNRLKAESDALRAQVEYSKFGSVIGNCTSMQRVFQLVDKVAQTKSSVLISGETGTGKELIARELHSRSTRRDHPFVVVNCGAMSENLLEAELFGYVRGAFPGATATRNGSCQNAHRGTLFLDEVSEISLHLQVKILNALNDHMVTKVGDVKSDQVDIRVIAATTKDLNSLVKEQLFREDLYYRLSVVEIEVPGLHERGNDVILIANYFLQKYAKIHGKNIIGFTEAAQNALINFPWPGNVRQLENKISRAVIMCDNDRVQTSELDIITLNEEGVLPLSEAIDRYRRQYIEDSLERNAGNRTRAAKELGIDPRTIFRHLEEQKKSPEVEKIR
jgi:transcriptional regulator with GAF, ATPase, and Fis domain